MKTLPKLSKLPKLSLKKETLTSLSANQLEAVAGGCIDDSSGDGLLCPHFAPKTRLTIMR